MIDLQTCDPEFMEEVDGKWGIEDDERPVFPSRHRIPRHEGQLPNACLVVHGDGVSVAHPLFDRGDRAR